MLAAPKTPQTLDFIDYRGVCPHFYRVTGNGERVTGNGERGMGNGEAS